MIDQNNILQVKRCESNENDWNLQDFKDIFRQAKNMYENNELDRAIVLIDALELKKRTFKDPNVDNFFKDHNYTELSHRIQMDYTKKKYNIYLERCKKDLKIPQLQSFMKNFSYVEESIDSLQKLGVSINKFKKPRDKVYNDYLNKKQKLEKLIDEKQTKKKLNVDEEEKEERKDEKGEEEEEEKKEQPNLDMKQVLEYKNNLNKLPQTPSFSPDITIDEDCYIEESSEYENDDEFWNNIIDEHDKQIDNQFDDWKEPNYSLKLNKNRKKSDLKEFESFLKEDIPIGHNSCISFPLQDIKEQHISSPSGQNSKLSKNKEIQLKEKIRFENNASQNPDFCKNTIKKTASPRVKQPQCKDSSVHSPKIVPSVQSQLNSHQEIRLKNLMVEVLKKHHYHELTLSSFEGLNIKQYFPVVYYKIFEHEGFQMLSLIFGRTTCLKGNIVPIRGEYKNDHYDCNNRSKKNESLCKHGLKRHYIPESEISDKLKENIVQRYFNLPFKKYQQIWCNLINDTGKNEENFKIELLNDIFSSLFSSYLIKDNPLRVKVNKSWMFVDISALDLHDHPIDIPQIPHSPLKGIASLQYYFLDENQEFALNHYFDYLSSKYIAYLQEYQKYYDCDVVQNLHTPYNRSQIILNGISTLLLLGSFFCFLFNLTILALIACFSGILCLAISCINMLLFRKKSNAYILEKWGIHHLNNRNKIKILTHLSNEMEHSLLYHELGIVHQKKDEKGIENLTSSTIGKKILIKKEKRKIHSDRTKHDKQMHKINNGVKIRNNKEQRTIIKKLENSTSENIGKKHEVISELSNIPLYLKSQISEFLDEEGSI